MNEGVDIAFRAAPNFFAQRMITWDDVAIVELVGPICPGCSAGFAGGGDHCQDDLLGYSAVPAPYNRQLRSKRRHLHQLFVAERVRGKDADRISLRRANEGERSACAAAGIFDD